MTHNKSVVIITPTTGSEELKQCINSVWAQTYPNIKHLVVVDGPEYFSEIENLSLYKIIETIRLPENVGANGWYGHRVYAAMPYLVNEDIVMFLDQDNWLEPNHVETMVDVIEQGYDWAYSLRKINTKEGRFCCDDNCENLGHWPSFQGNYHIDTSCFAIPREILVRGICGAWYGKWGADRQFFNILKQHYPNFGCSNQYSLNYRLSGNSNSPTSAFFDSGNRVMTQSQLSYVYPWRNKRNPNV